VTQFRPDGSFAAVTRMRLATVSGEIDAPETWSRVRLGDAGDRPMLLSPTSELQSRFEPGADEPWPRAAVPFAMDLTASEESGVFVRGWDGLAARVARYGLDGERIWDVRCDCELAAGITHDNLHAYIIDPAGGRVDAFRIKDGSPAGRMALGSGLRAGSVPELEQEEDGTPARPSPVVDIAALGAGRLALLEAGGWVRLADFIDGSIKDATTARWKTRTTSEPMAIGAAAGAVAVLFADGRVEVRSPEGALIDRWSPAADGVLAPSDVAVSSTGLSIVVIARGGTIARYAMMPGPRGIYGDDGVAHSGDCALTSSAAADPARLGPDERAQVTISLRSTCPPPADAVDIVIAWTPSRAFWYQHSYARAREAIDQLVRMLDVPGVRIEVVGPPPSGDGGAVLAPFGTPVAAVLDIVRDYRRTDFEQYRTWSDADAWPDIVQFSSDRLAAEARGGAERTVVLVGYPAADASVASAAAFLADGGHLFLMEFPEAMPDAPLKRVLKQSSDAIHIAHAGDVARVARRVLEPMLEPALRDPVLVVEHSDGMRYEAGSAAPSAIEESGRIGWRLGPLDTGQRVGYWTRPRRLGTLPAFERATLHATQPDGTRAAFDIPPPMVAVLEPTPEPEPSVTVGPPTTAFLPLARRGD